MGVALKLKYKSDVYFRYYFPEPENLTWKNVSNAVRLLFGIRDENPSVLYTDKDGDEIIVSNDADFHHMLALNASAKCIKLEVLSKDEVNKVTNVPQSSTMGFVQNQSVPPSVIGTVKPESVGASSHGNGNPGAPGEHPPVSYPMPNPEVPAK